MLLQVSNSWSVPRWTTGCSKLASVHSIAGRIIAERENRGEQDAGQISASLVQFGEALDHGISAEKASEMASLVTSQTPGHLFYVETGYPKEEIQNEFEVVDLDLLIIDYVVIYPEYRGLKDRRVCHSPYDRHFWCWLRAGSLQALAAAVHSVHCGRSRSVEKTCVTVRKQRRSHSEAEIVLVAPRVLAAW